jgi:DNA repair protein RadA/Sms
MYICTACHQSTLKWAGKCPSCGEWNTLEESKWDHKKSKWWGHGKALEGKKIEKNIDHSLVRYQSRSSELDGVLGGGLSRGSLVLLSGEPGIGKSTLALQMAEWYASHSVAVKSDEWKVKKEQKKTWENPEWYREVLYISWEEHIGQISARAHRLGVKSENIEIITESYFDDVVATIQGCSARIIIIDSLSVLGSDSLDGVSGSTSQVRTMTEVFMSLAKTLDKSIILIGHVTKDGSIGGPKALEHLVDVVLYLEWVRTENYRILRALKNRFGPTDSVGLFRMEESGLVDIPNPGLEFVDSATSDLPWSALTFTIEGNRPLLIEIEALTTYTKYGYPKRSSRWVPQGKLELLIAVMTKFTDTQLESYDVYVNVGRGFSLTEPGVDLATVAAMMSSKRGKSLGRTIYLWEVSLTGVVKNTYFIERRILEAVKLGFDRIVIPEQYKGLTPKGPEYVRVGSVRELVI